LHSLDVMPPKKPPVHLDVDCVNILPSKSSSLHELIEAILDSWVIEGVAKALGSVISGIVDTYLEAKLLSFTKSFNTLKADNVNQLSSITELTSTVTELKVENNALRGRLEGLDSLGVKISLFTVCNKRTTPKLLLVVTSSSWCLHKRTFDEILLLPL